MDALSSLIFIHIRIAIPSSVSETQGFVAVRERRPWPVSTSANLAWVKR